MCSGGRDDAKTWCHKVWEATVAEKRIGADTHTHAHTHSHTHALTHCHRDARLPVPLLLQNDKIFPTVPRVTCLASANRLWGSGGLMKHTPGSAVLQGTEWEGVYCNLSRSLSLRPSCWLGSKETVFWGEMGGPDPSASVSTGGKDQKPWLMSASLIKRSGARRGSTFV